MQIPSYSPVSFFLGRMFNIVFLHCLFSNQKIYNLKWNSVVSERLKDMQMYSSREQSLPLPLTTRNCVLREYKMPFILEGIFNTPRYLFLNGWEETARPTKVRSSNKLNSDSRVTHMKVVQPFYRNWILSKLYEQNSNHNNGNNNFKRGFLTFHVM